MSELLAKRCHLHLDREAAARCPECGQFFCRECVTEHEQKVICTSCLKERTTAQERRGAPLRGLLRPVFALAGATWCWLTFVWLGRILLAMPDRFHEGTLWKVGFWDK